MVADRGASPIVFESISVLPFTDAHVRQVSTDSATDDIRYRQGITEPYIADTSPVLVGRNGNAPTAELALEDNHALALPLISSHTNVHETAQSGRVSPSLPSTVHFMSGLQSSNVQPEPTDLRTNHKMEDFDDIDTSQIDRYGFYGQSSSRRQSNSSLDAVHLRGKQMRRSNTLSRNTLKRASMGLGLSPSLNYLEIPKHDVLPTTKEVKRAQKWTNMSRRSSPDQPFSFPLTPKLKSRVWKGIPDCWRAAAWSSFLLEGSSLSSGDLDLSERYLTHLGSKCDADSQIDLDVPRTISHHVMFRNRHEGGQLLLFRVLHSITLEFPETGYVQGMASVAATLLCYYTEEQAFAMLVRIWTSRGLVSLYQPGFPILLQAFERLETILRTTKVGRHLLEIGCRPLDWATRWYLTLFHISLPFHTQLRIWDIFMLHTARQPQGLKNVASCFEVLEVTTIALIEGMEETLLVADFEEAMRILTMPIQVQDDDVLLRAIRRKLET